MDAKIPAAKNVDEYIQRYPVKLQPVLQRIRRTIKKVAPNAKEVISYQIPAYVQSGMLIFFAAYKSHISIYPAPRGNEAFRKELSAYKGGKGTLQFPIGEPIPYDLIARITKFRLAENEKKAADKIKKAVPSGRNKKITKSTKR
jgi:uncharacterized protein YdhG (YjbR/CyaY superfamily)